MPEIFFARLIALAHAVHPEAGSFCCLFFRSRPAAARRQGEDGGKLPFFWRDEPVQNRSSSPAQQEFLGSAAAWLEALDRLGMRLEAMPRDPEALSEAQAVVEKLERGAAESQLEQLRQLARELRQVLTPEMARAARVKLADVLLCSAGALEAVLAAWRGGLPSSPAGDALHAMIADLRQCFPASLPPEPPPSRFQWNAHEREAIEAALRAGQPVYNLSMEPMAQPEMRAATLQLLSQMLRDNFCVLAIHPELIAGSETAALEAAVATDRGRDWVGRICRVPGLVRHMIVEELLPAPAPFAASQRLELGS